MSGAERAAHNHQKGSHSQIHGPLGSGGAGSFFGAGSLCGGDAGSVCGKGLSSTPLSTIGFERRFNRALHVDGEDAFVETVLQDLPPAPERQADIVAANRGGLSALL